MNKNDLYIEYARVIEMCKGTSFEHKPWVCVKIYDGFDSHPQFTQIPECYQFAIAILEDRAVFVGDILYLKSSGLEYVVDKYTTASAVSDMTWQPPKPKRRIVLEETHEENEKYRTGVFATQYIKGGIILHNRHKVWRIVEDTGETNHDTNTMD